MKQTVMSQDTKRLELLEYVVQVLENEMKGLGEL